MAEKLSTMINSSSTWSTFKNVANGCKKFGNSYGEYPYDVLDVQDLITKLKSNSTYSSTLSEELDALQAAFNEVVLHNNTTSDYKGAHGLCFFCPLSGANYKTGSYATYTKDHTNFEKWRVLVTNYGKWAN